MKCQNCNAEIPPAFVHAIQTNTCAGCGGQIMCEDDLQLLTELREAMLQMPNDAVGLSGWLLSNYTLKKIGAAEPTSFHRKTDRQNSAAPGLKIADNPVQKFLQRTDAGKELSKRNNSFQQIIAEIQSGTDDQYGGEQVEEDIEYSEEDDAINEAQMNRKKFRSEAKAKAQSSWNISDPNAASVKPLSPKEMQTISEFEVDQEPDLPPALQQARLLRLQKQQEISRGGKPGCFGRKG